MERGEKGSSLPLADRYNLMKSSLLIFAPLKDGAQKLTLIEASAFVVALNAISILPHVSSKVLHFLAFLGRISLR